MPPRQPPPSPRKPIDRVTIIWAVVFGALVIVLAGAALALQSDSASPPQTAGAPAPTRSVPIGPALSGALTPLVLAPAEAASTPLVLAPAEAAIAPLPPVVVSARPDPPNTEPNGLAWGPRDAPIKVEAFVDYQSPLSARYALQEEPVVMRALAPTGKVRYELNLLITLEGPVRGRESRDAAQAAMCAADQNKFWQMHYALFQNQRPQNSGGFARARLKEIAHKAGLNAPAFDACLDANKHEQATVDATQQHLRRGIDLMPSFVVNGRVISGTQSLGDLSRVFAEVAPGVSLAP